MPDYDRRKLSANYGQEGRRLRALADELDRIQDRLREIADEIPYGAAFAKRLPREFRALYEAKRAEKEIEFAAVKTGSVASMVRAGATVIEPYDDP